MTQYRDAMPNDAKHCIQIHFDRSIGEDNKIFQSTSVVFMSIHPSNVSR